MTRAAFPLNYQQVAAVPWEIFNPAVGSYSTSNSGGGTAAFVASPNVGSPFTRSVQLDITATATHYVEQRHTGLTPKLAVLRAGDVLIVPIWVTATPQYVTQLGLSMSVSSDNFSTKSGSMTGNMPVRKTDGWAFGVIETSTFSSGNGMLVTDQINWLALRVVNAAGGGAVQCFVGGIYIAGRARPKCVIQFDDGLSSSYTIAFADMQARGLKGCIGVIADRVGTAGYCTLAQLQEMRAAGWQMMPHGDTDHVTLETSAAVAADVEHNASYIRANFSGQETKDYIYPAGLIASYSIATLQLLGYRTARTTIGSSQVSEFQVPFIGGQMTQLATPLNQNLTPAQILARHDLANRHGSLSVFYGHNITASPTDNDIEISTANWTTFIDGVSLRVKQGLVDVVTTERWYRGLTGARAAA